MTYKTYLKEVETEFLKLGKPLSKAHADQQSESFFKGTKYTLYDIRVRDYNKLLKFNFKFSHKPQEDKAKIWSYIFKNTQYLDVGSVAINYFKQFQNRKTYDLAKDWSLLKTWAPKIENWVHGDMLCGLYCDILSLDAKSVYPELVKWSKSRSPWKNRLAMLSLLYYYNPKRNKLSYSKCIKLIHPHINEDHYYLQKAIGWTLREMLKAHPKQTWAYVMKNCTNFSSTAFTTIVENIPKTKKEPLKEKRRLHRKNKRKK